MQEAERLETRAVEERDIIVGKLKVHITSVFSEQTTLEKAICNIATRRKSKSQADLSA